MNRQALWCLGLTCLLLGTTARQVWGAESPSIGLYRLFEARVENSKPYANKFADVELSATYTAPSGRTCQFGGFFDGDGRGGGDRVTGTVWKLRFMPNELGRWTYVYRWSDGTPGGKTTIEARAGASSTHIFDEVAAPGAGRLVGRIDHPDVRADDNEKTLELPPATAPQADAPPSFDSLAGARAIEAESDLRGSEQLGSDAASVSATGRSVPPWLILVLAAVALSVGEWCFNQRRWIS